MVDFRSGGMKRGKTCSPTKGYLVITALRNSFLLIITIIIILNIIVMSIVIVIIVTIIIKKTRKKKLRHKHPH